MILASWLGQHLSQILIAGAVGIVTLVSYHIYQLYSSRKGLPPGPLPLPFIGNILLFRGKNKHLHHIIEDLSRKYGGLFTFYFGHRPHVIVADKDLCLLVMQKHQFAGRPKIPIFEELFKPGSVAIVSSDFNPEWEVLRKVAHSAMRKYAVSERLPIIVADVVDQVVERWIGEGLVKEEINLKTWMKRILSSIFATSAFGGRFSLDDAELEKWTETQETIDDYSKYIMLFAVIPWLKYFYLPFYRKFKEGVHYSHYFMEKKYKEHVKTFDGKTIRDFTDAMLMAKKEAEEEESENPLTAHYLRDWNIINSVNSLFTAGNAAMNTILLWIFLFLANYPDHQRKIRKELEEVIGEKEIPTLEHRLRCHYTAAFIAEIFRFRHAFPLNILHKAQVDMEITHPSNGKTYLIPKGTTVHPHLFPGLTDREVWGDPDIFRPERFLDDQGYFISKPNPYFIPFSAGRRTCPGEKLALFDVFFIVARMIQRVSISGEKKFEIGLSGGPGSVDLYGNPSNTRGCHANEYRIILKPIS